MRKFSKKYYILLIVLILLWLGVGLGWQIYRPKEPKAGSQVVFNIEKGEGLTDIASNLEEEGLIRSKYLFTFYTLVRNSTKNLQAGRYHLAAAMNIPQILNKLSQGDTIKENITIIEGWDLRDIGWYFENKGIFQAEEIFEMAGFPAIDYAKAADLPQPKDFSEEFEFLKEKPENISLEGYLFPDTYQITQGMSLEEILRKMLENFDGKITEDLKEEIASQEKTLFEILVMASLLEDEMQSYQDRQIAAGILWKRLKAGWPLQVDATLTYLTGKASSELTKKDLETDSPYNTYRYDGLPLGPIGNPGLEAIKAAVYYEDSPYWYYLTISDGQTIFSQTLAEHNAARFKYLK